MDLLLLPKKLSLLHKMIYTCRCYSKTAQVISFPTKQTEKSDILATTDYKIND